MTHRAWSTVLRWLVPASVILSAAGILIAICLGNAAHGGRGGALAVMGSLVVFFLNLRLDEEVAKTITATLPEIARMIDDLKKEDKRDAALKAVAPPRVEDRLSALEQAGRISNQAMKEANRKLAWATGIGTLAWGFGDIAAGLFL